MALFPLYIVFTYVLAWGAWPFSLRRWLGKSRNFIWGPVGGGVLNVKMSEAERDWEAVHVSTRSSEVGRT